MTLDGATTPTSNINTYSPPIIIPHTISTKLIYQLRGVILILMSL